MTEKPRILMWEGRPVTEMSREELLEVVAAQHEILAQFLNAEAARTYAIGRLARLKSGDLPKPN